MKRQPTENVDASVDAFGSKASTADAIEIGARIKEARKALRLTQNALATLSGAASNRGLQDNESGKAMPGGQMIRALVRAGVNANWLLTGEGPMLLADLLPPVVKPVAPRINVEALEAILEGTLRIAPRDTPAGKIAAHCVKLYKSAFDQGLITADGIGSGDMNTAA